MDFEQDPIFQGLTAAKLEPKFQELGQVHCVYHHTGSLGHKRQTNVEMTKPPPAAKNASLEAAHVRLVLR